MKHYDYVVVGAGLFGAVFAREMHDAGKSCLVVDQRDTIGGNLFTKVIQNIPVHMYGAHIFRTDSKYMWDYVNKFTQFRFFHNSPIVKCKDKVYSFPINLLTLYQLWGVTTPSEAIKTLELHKEKITNPKTLEQHLLATVGRQIYEIFFEGYTLKQWGKHPSELLPETLNNIPIRFNFNDSYYDEAYQGIPVNGYTPMIKNMLSGIDVETETDYFAHKSRLDSVGDKILFTGEIDKFFDYKYGPLSYRSLKFTHKELDENDFQGVAVVNYTDVQVPYTRSIEHKHFSPFRSNTTVVSFEYASEYDVDNEPYYPIMSETDLIQFSQYQALKKQFVGKYIFGGRLPSYRVLSMNQTIHLATKSVGEELI